MDNVQDYYTALQLELARQGWDYQAAQARDQLLRSNPDAQRQLKLFRAEIDNGKWAFVGRYGRPLAQP